VKRPLSAPVLALALALSACGESESPHLMVGTLERDRIEIVAEAAEPIVSLDVREGQHVVRGQQILAQDTAIAVARAEQAAARVEELRQRLTELENGARVEEVDRARAQVARAQAALDRDERELARVGKLVADRLVSQTQLDAAQAARNASRAELQAARAQHTELRRGTRPEEIAQARAALATAEGARRELEVSDARLVVRATRAGVVDALPYKAGERPPRGAPVAVLLADGATFARVYVPEPLRARVRPGTAATIRVDGISQPLRGRVRYVASDAAFTPYYALTQRDRSRLAFLSEVEVVGSAADELPAGVPVEVTLD
jgi:HlyD family secretion protein